MNAEHLTDRVCEFARSHLAPKAKNNLTKFLIGASTVGAGRNLLHRKIVEMTAAATDEDGEIDVRAMKDSIMGGFELATSVPALNGMICLDAQDARDFFAHIGV